MKKLFICLSIVTVFLFLTDMRLQSQWVHMPGRMDTVTTSVLSLLVSGNTIFAGTSPNGVLMSTNFGANWSQTPLNNVDVSSLVVSGTNILAGSVLGVSLSTNNGATWTTIDVFGTIVYSLAASGNNVYAGTFDNGVCLSTNNGANWTHTSLNTHSIWGLAVNSSYIFAGDIFSNGVYVSSNGGTSWTQTSLNSQSVFSIAINGNNIFAGTQNNHLYISTNNGSNWTNTTLNDGNFIHSLSVIGNNIFAGTDNGVSVSNDNGATWTLRNEGLSSGSNTGNAFCVINNNIYLGDGFGNGIYRRPLSELIGIRQISEQVPSEYSLLQNYPNPFNPSTKIRFEVPKTDNVTIKVFDISGREIAVLVNQTLKPGIYEETWDAGSYASGIYFYRLETGNYTKTMKMILVK